MTRLCLTAYNFPRASVSGSVVAPISGGSRKIWRKLRSTNSGATEKHKYYKLGGGEYIKTQLSCILFIRLTTCFGHCGPSSGHKNIQWGENIQYKNISCSAYSEFSTRSRCLAVIYIETNNTGWFKKIDSISYVYISWTIPGMWTIYITFERGSPNYSNNTARAIV